MGGYTDTNRISTTDGPADYAPPFPDPTALAVSVKYGRSSKYKYASERFESSNLSFNTST